VKLLEAITQMFPAPRLTAKRVVLAFAVAVAADAVQLAMVPLGPLAFLPHEAIDVVAMALTFWLLGFHILLLPTFVLELVPVLGAVSPTWTACVAAVVALRKREQKNESVPQDASSAPVESNPPQLPAAEPSRLSETTSGPADAQSGERPREPARLSESSSGPADGVDANPS
jgi:hypothetical protein